MLEIAPAKIAQIIAYGHEMDRAEPELRGLLEALNEEEGQSLVAVMWIGRGTFAAEDLAEALATAQAEATTPTADYLIGTPHFAEHLETGMELLGLDAEADDMVYG